MRVIYNENFRKDIKFENNRYTVKLPLKEHHPLIPDNYTTSLKCLVKLKIS